MTYIGMQSNKAIGGLSGADSGIETKDHIQMLLRWYGELLRIPVDSEWRLRHQDLYGAVRDALAADTGVDPEAVQTFCEAVAQ